MDIITFNNFKKWFQSIDKETQEFQDVFELVNDSYFDVPKHKQDDYTKAATLLNKLATRGDEEFVMLTAKIAEEVFKVLHQKSEAAHAYFKVDENSKTYFFDIYTNKKQLESLHTMLRNTVIRKNQQ